MNRLCLCLTAPTIAGMFRQVDACKEYIDMAELCFDAVAPRFHEKIMALPTKLTEHLGRPFPMILKIRSAEHGVQWGQPHQTEKERIQRVMDCVSSGTWAWVDLEWDTSLDAVTLAAKKSGTRVIRSRYDFSDDYLNRPVAEIAADFRAIAEKGSLPKLVVQCTNSCQLLTLARLSIAVSEITEKIIFGMGEYGNPSCILASRFGSAWAYATEPSKGEDLTDLWQTPPSVLQQRYRFRSIDPDTPLFGVVGHPIAHSLSPQIHNTWFQDAGIPGTYLPILTDNMGALLETCDILGIVGLSVTHPHKKTALERSEYADLTSQRIGVANTLMRAGDGWRGGNTDVAGFLAPLRRTMKAHKPLEECTALIIGAGGAARAAAYGLKDAGVQLVILNRTLAKAEHLAREVQGVSGLLGPESAKFLENVDIVVQTTTLGMHPDIHQDPIPWWNPKNSLLVYDLIYDPPETTLLKRARESGVMTLNGRDMLNVQARLQFEMFLSMIKK